MNPLSPSTESERGENASADLDLQQAIRRRAEEIYVCSGRIEGRDLENWAQAEQEIRKEAAHIRRAVVIKVNNIQYIGEYSTESAQGYRSGELSAGASTRVRFEGDKMFVTRPNGRELETTIVRQIE